MIRPVETETLEDICREIALDNYGFLYVNDHKTDIKDDYESAETGPLKASSLSASDIKEELRDIATSDLSEFERRRNGVYFLDPFDAREGRRISDELSHMFFDSVVINKQMLESRFDIAPTDVDFFADRLVSEDYIERITAGERDYYVSGPRLKDEASGDTSVNSQLAQEATRGTVSQSDLETVINVAATDDVIRFLDKQGFIVDIGGEYIVESELDTYARSLAREIGDDAVDEIESYGLLPASEFRTIISNELGKRFDLIQHIDEDLEASLIDAVETELADQYDLELDRDIVVDPETFEEYVDRRARRLREELEADHELATPSDYEEIGYPEIDEMTLSDVGRVNHYFRDSVREEFDSLVEQRFSTSSEA